MSVAHVIREHGRPTLVMSHNKTLAAQLYGELKSLFPHNAVEYFISYYDYYQPEAYVPTTDTYIEKDASINEDIDRLRLRATSSLMEREDVIIVATVSAIYGLGDPVQYREQMVTLTKGQRIPRDEILRAFVRIQYGRNDVAFERGTFRVRGDTVEIFPAYEEQGLRIEMWGNEVERISKINVLTGETIAALDRAAIYPAKHFVTNRPTLERAIGLLRAELVDRLAPVRRDIDADLAHHAHGQRIERARDGAGALGDEPVAAGNAQLAADDSGNVTIGRSFGKTHGAIESVASGKCQRRQAKPALAQLGLPAGEVVLGGVSDSVHATYLAYLGMMDNCVFVNSR